jgi:Holliday junction resolvase RusA-like endonuclease
VTRRVAFTVPGEPRGKGRPRATAALNGAGEPFVRMHTPRETRQAEKVIRDAFKARHPGHRPWTGPVLLRFTAVFQTPAGFNQALRDAADRGLLYAVKKPDKDNIEKLIVDALNGVAFVDDQQVMGGGLKRYGSPARLDISFEQLDSPDVPATPGQLRAERAQAQPRLEMAPRPAREKPTKSQTDKPAKSPPDLSGYPERQRTLIERALARDAVAQVERQKRGRP